MRKARVRVEAKRLPLSAHREDQIRNVIVLQRIFRRKCGEYGIMQAFRDHQFFTRPTDKRRRKRMAKKHAQQHGRVERTREERDYFDYNF